MTLVIVLNVLFIGGVLAAIVGLHAWAILSSRPQQEAGAQAGVQEPARASRQRRQRTARRLASSLALR